MTVTVDDAVLEGLAAQLSERVGPEKQIRELQLRLKRGQALVVHNLERIETAYAEVDRLHAELAGLEVRTDEVLLPQLRTICRLDEVESVDLTEHGLEFCTRDLVSQQLDDGTRRVFGRFHVTFTFDGGVHVECLNTREVKDPATRGQRFYLYEHPHVFPRKQYRFPMANVCFGNVGGAVTEYIGAHEYGAAAALTVQFLSRFNPNGGYSAEPWVVFDEKQEKRIANRLAAIEKAGGGVVLAGDAVLGVGVAANPAHVVPNALPTGQVELLATCPGSRQEAINGLCPRCGMDTPLQILGFHTLREVGVVL